MPTVANPITLFLFNAQNVKFSVDKGIFDLYESQEVTVTLTHKKIWGSKLRKFIFTNQESTLFGKLEEKEELDRYRVFQFQLDTQVQNFNYAGIWDFKLAIGPYERPLFTIIAKAFVNLPSPELDLEYKPILSFTVTKSNDTIFIGKYFTLNDSLLGCEDRIAPGAEEPEVMYKVYSGISTTSPTTESEVLLGDEYDLIDTNEFDTSVMNKPVMWVALPVDLILVSIENNAFSGDYIYNNGPVPGVPFGQNPIEVDEQPYMVYYHNTLVPSQVTYHVIVREKLGEVAYQGTSDEVPTEQQIQAGDMVDVIRFSEFTSVQMTAKILWLALPIDRTLTSMENTAFSGDFIYNNGPVPGVQFDTANISIAGEAYRLYYHTAAVPSQSTYKTIISQ